MNLHNLLLYLSSVAVFAIGTLQAANLTADMGVSSAGYRLFALYNHPNEASLFHVPSRYSVTPETSLRQDAWIRYQQGGFSALLTGRYTLLNNQASQGDFFANEFYYDAPFGAFNFSVGKKILGWDFGQAFRPMDVIQREDRRRLIQTDLLGLPLVAIERFTDKDAYTFVFAHRLAAEGLDVAPGRNELAVKYFRTFTGSDLAGVAHWSEPEGVGAGLGLSSVIGDTLELHGSFFVREHCQKFSNLLAASGPVITDRNPAGFTHRNTCAKVVVGASWTDASGLGVLVEAWHDGEAHTLDEWREERDLLKRQRALLEKSAIPPAAVFQNLSAQQQFLDQPVLLENNVLLRLSYEGSRFRPSLELLLTPEDLGLVVTARGDYEMSTHLHLVGAARWFTGASGSAYSEIPNDLALFVGIEVSFAP